MPCIDGLYRYPVKGLGGEALKAIDAAAGENLPIDRAYAIAQGAAPFDPLSPAWLSKTHFVTLMTHPRLAGLRVSFREPGREIRVERTGAAPFVAALAEDTGRAAFSAYLAEFIGGEVEGTPRVVTAPGHAFSDVRDRCLSILNLASLRALGEHVGQPLDPLRFRANVYVEGLPAWIERRWHKESELLLGAVRMRVLRPISRCAATNVNPRSAQVDCNIPLALRQRFEKNFMGVYAAVIDGGVIRDGAAVTVPLA